MSDHEHEGYLHWRTIKVDGRPASFGEAGEGPTVVFVHGWGLGDRAYKRPLSRLARRGCRVLAPSLPGFGSTAALPASDKSLHGYAAWLAAFISTVVGADPVILIGHSFGGGVAIQYAHDRPGRVRYLVLVNSVGGSAEMAERPIWSWGVGFAREMFPPRNALRLANAIREDFVPNAVRNPRALLEAANLARTANLQTELEELRRRGLPVLALRGKADGVIPQAAFEALCAAVGAEGQVLPGSHSWLLADPDAFDQVLANVITAGGAKEGGTE